MTKITKASLGAIVDKLGELKAQISELTTQEKDLKAVLVDSGETAIEGDLFRATVSRYTQEVRDDELKARIEELIVEHLSRQYLSAHTVDAPRTTVKLVAQTRKTTAKVLA